MRFDWWTLALETLNFGVLVWLLHRFLYRPVLRIVDRRRAEIDKRRAEAEAATGEAKAELAGIERQRAALAAERDAALKAAAAESERAAKDRIAKAEQEAKAVLEDARHTLARERDAALAEVRRAALDLGSDIARRLLAELPAKVRAEAWLDRLDRRIADMPAGEREALAHQVANGIELVVATAAALPAESADAWRARLQATLGKGVKLAFEADPKLVAGAELRFPNAVIGYSWHDMIASIRAEIETDADAR